MNSATYDYFMDSATFIGNIKYYILDSRYVVDGFLCDLHGTKTTYHNWWFVPGTTVKNFSMAKPCSFSF